MSYSINYMDAKSLIKQPLGVLAETGSDSADNSLIVERESEEDNPSQSDDSSLDSSIHEEVDIS